MADSELRKRGSAQRQAKDDQKHPKGTQKAEKRPSGNAKWITLGALVLGLVFWYSRILLGSRDGTVEDTSGRPKFSVDHSRRKAVVEAFKHSWEAYERDAYGFDNYHPITKKGTNLAKSGGIGYMIVDVIDTMQIMNLTNEYERARTWIANELSFEQDDSFNTFETTIRVLGGLLSAYHLSNEDPVFLEKAEDLGKRILEAFDTPSGLPLPMVNLKRKHGVGEDWYPNLVGTAEAATLQLELRYLSHLTDNEEFWYKAENVMKVIRRAAADAGLVPIYMDSDTGRYIPSEIRLGSRGDSFYEYLLKQYLQTERKEEVYREMYAESMDGIHNHLLQNGIHEGHLYTSEFILVQDPYGEQPNSWERSPKQDHLVCFLGGSLMLGATTTGAFVDEVSVPPKPTELSPVGQRDWKTGIALIDTCMDTYDSETGLSPEIAHFYVNGDGRDPEENGFKDWYVKGMEDPEAPPSYDARYMLRPETVESLFIAFRLTGDKKYRDYGWKIFQSIQRHARVKSGGYATVLDVNNEGSEKEDKMETFFLSETLKYLYLLFSDENLLPLDRYVFNTEAHPLPKFKPTIRTGFT